MELLHKLTAKTDSEKIQAEVFTDSWTLMRDEVGQFAWAVTRAQTVTNWENYFRVKHKYIKTFFF